MSNFHTPPKQLREIDMRLPENTVKGAVQLDKEINRYLVDQVITSTNTDSYTYFSIDKQV